jgi:RNA polymerase sigma-70 factor (ECF subfamily)
MLSKEKLNNLYKCHHREIFRYLLRMLRNHEASEDILQDVFERFIVYTKEKDIKEKNIRAFLYKVAHNCAINYIKKNNRNSAETIEEIAETINANDEPFKNLFMDELNNQIYRILNTFPPEYRSMFILNKESEMTYSEIAVHLGISERTVRRRIKAVVERLYVELKKSGYE